MGSGSINQGLRDAVEAISAACPRLRDANLGNVIVDMDDEVVATKSGWAQSVLNIAGLRDVVEEDREDMQVRAVENIGIYIFDAQSTEDPDQYKVVSPYIGSGRWKLVSEMASGFSFDMPVEDMDLNEPPLSPSEGDRHIAASGGSWTENYIYEYTTSGWIVKPPKQGVTVYVESETTFYTFNGAAWVISIVPASNLKVNTTIYVDEAYGNDGTGAVDDPSKPFKTPAAAAAAVDDDGYTIQFNPGSYSGDLNLADWNTNVKGSGKSNTLLNGNIIFAGVTGDIQISDLNVGNIMFGVGCNAFINIDSVVGRRFYAGADFANGIINITNSRFFYDGMPAEAVYIGSGIVNIINCNIENLMDAAVRQSGGDLSILNCRIYGPPTANGIYSDVGRLTVINSEAYGGNGVLLYSINCQNSADAAHPNRILFTYAQNKINAGSAPTTIAGDKATYVGAGITFLPSSEIYYSGGAGGPTVNDALNSLASNVISIARTAFVDTTNGNDATAEIGKPNKSFKTIGAANTAVAALSPNMNNQCCVSIAPGTYNETCTCVNYTIYNFNKACLAPASGHGIIPGTMSEVNNAVIYAVAGSSVYMRDATQVAWFNNCLFVGNLDCSAAGGADSGIFFNNCFVANTSGTTFNCSDATHIQAGIWFGSYIQLNESGPVPYKPNITLNSCHASSLPAMPTVGFKNLYAQGSRFNMTITADNLVVSGCYFYALGINYSGTGNATCFISGTIIDGNLTILGAASPRTINITGSSMVNLTASTGGSANTIYLRGNKIGILNITTPHICYLDSYDNVASITGNGTINYSIMRRELGTKAFGSFYVNTLPIDGDYVTIAGVTFTFKDSPSGDTEVQIGIDIASTVDNFISKINAYSSRTFNAIELYDDYVGILSTATTTGGISLTQNSGGRITVADGSQYARPVLYRIATGKREVAAWDVTRLNSGSKMIVGSVPSTVYDIGNIRHLFVTTSVGKIKSINTMTVSIEKVNSAECAIMLSGASIIESGDIIYYEFGYNDSVAP